jgi:uncharacterized membrane protein
MKNEIRSGKSSTETDIHSSQIDTSFLSLKDAVRQRTTPAKTNPVAIPQKLSTSEFNMAMVHFYRGEVQRSNAWRVRLDTTTNWAVVTAGATLSFVFSSPDNPHFAIPINSILVSIFLFMEARRYRYYEIWASRVRVLETGYFAPMLSSQSIPPDKEWAEHLSADLLSPHFTISDWEAVGRRLRSNYLWIFILLALSWSLKIYLHPFPAVNFEMLIDRARVGLAPGGLVIAVGAIFNLALFFISIGTLRLKDASSEVLSADNFEWHPLKEMSEITGLTNLRKRNTIRRAKKARHRVRTANQESDKE